MELSSVLRTTIAPILTPASAVIAVVSYSTIKTIRAGDQQHQGEQWGAFPPGADLLVSLTASL